MSITKKANIPVAITNRTRKIRAIILSYGRAAVKPILSLATEIKHHRRNNKNPKKGINNEEGC